MEQGRAADRLPPAGRRDAGPDRRGRALPGNESTPDFNADGKRVAFTRNRAPGVDTASVWSVRRDGSDLRQLSTGDMAARVPKFSPDGRHVSFFAGNGLVVMGLDGSDWRRLTRRLRTGRYVLRVRALDARGNVRGGRPVTLRVR